MRFAVRSTVTLIALYLLALGGFVGWMQYELRSVAATLMQDTARLVGSEIAAAMSESALDQLLQADPAARQRFEQLVADLTTRSDVVASLTVVDESGKVVVSDELDIGRQLAIPDVVFQGSTRPPFLSPQSPLEGGTYHLFVPLVRQASLVGYIRLSLSSHRIADLYRRARRPVALAAFIGLTFIGSLGFLFHVQLSRRGAALARTLEATARGEVVPAHARRDEFSQVIEAAGRLGRELNETRARSSQAQRRISALASFMDIGVLLLRPDRTLEFANTAARELLGAGAADALEQHWESIRSMLDAALDEPTEGRSPGAYADLEVPVNGRVGRLRIEMHRPEEDQRAGYLVLVKDLEVLEAFETDLRMATQMRGLARVYGALAHELKAPLGAMALNLELLNEALNAATDPDADQRARERRYAEVLRDELARLNRSLIAVLNQTTSLSETGERFDVRQLVRDLETLLAPQAMQQHVTLAVQLPDGEVLLAAQRDRLKQALLNIATNALEAMPDGGEMRMSLETEDGRATISIRDSGPGIDPEMLDKVYRMHFTTKTGGTGIGLYVARSVVESLGGTIQVESQCGTGSCFTVILPLSAEPT